jgi:hypothetical protein
VDTPGYEQLLLITDQALKCAIIDYGSIAVSMLNCGQDLHGSSVDDLNHSVLIIGWNSNGEWYIKDSWPNKQGIYYKAINVFQSSFMAKFFRVKYENSGSVISCSGSGCSTVFSSRSCVDNDGDGFYNWGIGDKPEGFPGPCKMDFNDADPSKIFLNSNYLEVPTPTVSGSNYACSSGTTYQLNNLPTGFSASWSVSNPTFFNNSNSGSGTSATLYPKSHYAGDYCVITFTISDGCGSAQYSRSFAINGPEDSKVDINVVASNAPTPIRISGVWLLCPNSSYYIYFNNTSDCSTSNYQWIIPSGWTKYEQSSNYIRINTNSSPFGTVNVTAATCCGSGYPVITQNFSQGYCTNPYFSAYPNPATTDVTVMFKDAFDLNTVDETTTVEIYDLGFSKKYTAEKIEKELKVKTGGWKSGFYYIILTHKGVKYYEKIMVDK